MQIRPIKTRVLVPPKDDLLGAIKQALSAIALREKSILAVASKVAAVWQGRCLSRQQVKDKDELIKKEADFYLERKETPGQCCMLTIKNNLLVPTAGIDESNASDYYILWPERPYQAAKEIGQFLKKEFGLKEVGVVITHSRCTPGRVGTTGIALAYWGFKPLKDYRGQKDLFQRELKMTQSNLIDGLASAAVVCMGEGREQTPLVLMENVDLVEFTSQDPDQKDIEMEREEDMFYPLLRSVKWQKR